MAIWSRQSVTAIYITTHIMGTRHAFATGGDMEGFVCYRAVSMTQIHFITMLGTQEMCSVLVGGGGYGK